MASLGFVSAQALPNISLISNAKSVSRSRLLADSPPEKIYLNDALFPLILKKSELFNPKSQLDMYVTVFTSYPHLSKNRLGKIGRLELRFLKIVPF